VIYSVAFGYLYLQTDMLNQIESKEDGEQPVDPQIDRIYFDLERKILDEIGRQLGSVDSLSLLKIAMANGSRRRRTQFEVNIPLDEFGSLTPESLSALRNMSLDLEGQGLIGIEKPIEFTPFASNRLTETRKMPNGDQLTPRQTTLVDMAEEYCRAHFPTALASHLDIVVRAVTQIIDTENGPAIKLILYPNLKVDAKTVASAFSKNFGYINEMSGPKLIDGNDGLPSACFFSVNSSLDVLSKGLVDLIGSGKVAFHVSEGTNQLSLIRYTDLTPDEIEALDALEPALAAVNKWLAGFDLPSSTISVLRQARDPDGKKQLTISRVKFQMSLGNEIRYLMTDKNPDAGDLARIHQLIRDKNSRFIPSVTTELGGVTIRLVFTPIVEQQLINPDELPYYQTIWNTFMQDQVGEGNTDSVVVLGPNISHNYYVREHEIAPGCNLYMFSNDNAVVV
jgi:hypothetical protein